jgi:hypothetical protein
MSEVYDKAKYHSGGDWPEGLPEEQSFVHGGLFLGWLMQRGLVSEEVDDELVRDFKKRRRTGPRIYEELDGVLDDAMLTDDGNAFAKAYFDLGTGAYISEYQDLLAADLESVYAVADTWDNYEKLRELLDLRFRQWQEGRLEEELAADGYGPGGSDDGDEDDEGGDDDEDEDDDEDDDEDEDEDGDTDR